MKILQVSCSYFPDKIGGTEVYVHNLNQELISRGYAVFVSYIAQFYGCRSPFLRIRNYTFKGVPTFVIEKNTFSLKTKDLYMVEDLEIYQVFKDYLRKIQPDIVHFHHFSPTDVISQMKAAKEMHIPIILTYHTPMMTCGHTDMLYLGKSPCHGRIDYKKCLICTQSKYGVPLFLAYLWANLPKNLAESLGKSVSKININNRFATWLQLPWLTRERIEKWREGLRMIDHFVAVSLWVYELLIKNNIPKERITLCRQGIGQTPSNIKRREDGNLRLGYLGRIHPVKGVDILLKAFELLPSHYRIELYIYGSFQDKADEKYYNKLRQMSYKDKRIKWSGTLNNRERFSDLSKLDVLVIPSRWLETGPLVLLESWAVGTPIIGSRLGGIAELVTEGLGGLLFEPEDAQDLARAIIRIYNEPGLLGKLKLNIPKVRTMQEVADEMENLYHRLM